MRVERFPATAPALDPALAAAHRSGAAAPVRRAVDLAVASAGLVAAVLLACLLLVLNPILNPGPLLYRQERMGQHGNRFTMWKFRTMCPEAGPRRRRPGDPLEAHRVTPLGRLLRRAHLDELPNFFSVLRGDMSVIGPRAEMLDHARIFIATVPHYSERLAVKPGITGLAQLRAGYADTPEVVRRKVRWDRVYIRRASLGLDLYILLRTVPSVLFGIGGGR